MRGQSESGSERELTLPAPSRWLAYRVVFVPWLDASVADVPLGCGLRVQSFVDHAAAARSQVCVSGWVSG